MGPGLEMMHANFCNLDRIDYAFEIAGFEVLSHRIGHAHSVIETNGSVRSRNMAAMAKHVPGQGDVRKSTCPLQGLLERTSFLGQQELVDIDECHAVISAAKVQQRVC